MFRCTTAKQLSRPLICTSQTAAQCQPPYGAGEIHVPVLSLDITQDEQPITTPLSRPSAPTGPRDSSRRACGRHTAAPPWEESQPYLQPGGVTALPAAGDIHDALVLRPHGHQGAHRGAAGVLAALGDRLRPAAGVV